MWRKIINVAVITGIIGFVPQWVNSQSNALTINDCIQIAVKNNSSLKNAERRVEIAGSNVTSARSVILPTLNASFNPRRTFQAPAGPILESVQEIDPQTISADISNTPSQTMSTR